MIGGHHLSKEQLVESLRSSHTPHPDTLERVSSWLEHNGVPTFSIPTTHGGGWLTVTGIPVAQVNELLAASYKVYHHSGSNETILRTIGYALPTALHPHPHVQAIAPTTAFTSTRLLEQTPSSRSGGAAANLTFGGPVNISSRDFSFVHPSYLRSLYGTAEYTPLAMERNSLAIVGFDNDYPMRDDLEVFMANFDPVTSATFTSVPVNPGHGLYYPAERANFRTQYSVAMSYPTPVTYYMVGGIPARIMYPSGWPSPDDPLLSWLNYMIGMESVPQTINTGHSVSFEATIPQEYSVTLCRLFGVLGARGATVLTPSGNSGVGPGNCQDPSGHVYFRPIFPASCTCSM